MHSMRIGPVGTERPLVRVDEKHSVDVSDVVIMSRGAIALVPPSNATPALADQPPEERS